jgi:eukaryotic-like serine/threonine-protein kinase
MTFRRWQEIERVYHAALERPPKIREEFLTEACKNDSELRREVESLLAHDSSKTGTLDQPAWVGLDGLTAADATATVMPPGSQLGPYKIEGILGKGGMDI